MNDQEIAADLVDRAEALDNDLDETGPEPHGRVLGTWSNDTRRLVLSALERQTYPRFVVAVWHCDDRGRWWPSKHGAVTLRLCDLASFARAVAGALMGAHGVLAGKRHDPAEVHLRAAAEARKEVNGYSTR